MGSLREFSISYIASLPEMNRWGNFLHNNNKNMSSLFAMIDFGLLLVYVLGFLCT